MHRIVASIAVLVASTTIAHAQTWTPLANQPPVSPDMALLLTDGTVMLHTADPNTGYGTGDWWRLTPDQLGSYANGTWSQLASMPAGYAPLYFASAVLPDGRVIVEGGEYNGTATSETTLGAIYDPVGNVWSAVAPPSGWPAIGDAPSAVLANGVFMVGSSELSQQALFNPATLGWTITGSGKADVSAEEGWTLLPNGDVLTVDVVAQNGNSELYNPASGTWSSAGNTGVLLTDASYEIGPAILRPDGTVFATGATPHTAVYTPKREGCHATPASWQAGPDFPVTSDGQVVIADGPAALLPGGNVLAIASPAGYNAPIHAFEFDGAALKEVPAPVSSQSDASYDTSLLVLPTGEVLFIGYAAPMQLYSSTGMPQRGWAPEITEVAHRLTRGTTHELHGRQLNGLSQAVGYGDDMQSATNYPLVRITNLASGHTFYARTHDHSTMAVATGERDVSTRFDVPATAEVGPSSLVVVANGIASHPVRVHVE
jgi:hypothetical protein